MTKKEKEKCTIVKHFTHPTLKIDDSEKMTPEVAHFYNSTKYGADMLDQIAKKYSTKSASQRWPIQVFFNILNMAAIDAWVIYKETIGININCHNFILNLVEELRAKHVPLKLHFQI